MAYTKPVVTTHLPTKVFIVITGVILSISMTHGQPLVSGSGMRFCLVAQSGLTQPVLPGSFMRFSGSHNRFCICSL